MVREDYQREHRDDNGQRKPRRGHKDMEEEDVHNDRPKDEEPQCRISSAQDEQASKDLQRCHGMKIAGGKHGPKKFTGMTGWRLHRNEVEKGIRSEYHEDQAKENLANDADYFHKVGGLTVTLDSYCIQISLGWRSCIWNALAEDSGRNGF